MWTFDSQPWGNKKLELSYTNLKGGSFLVGLYIKILELPSTLYSLMECNALTSVWISQDSKFTVKIEQYQLIKLIDEYSAKLKFMVAGE